MNDHQAKESALEILTNYGAAELNRLHAELFGHLDFWKVQVADPISRRRFDEILPKLTDLATAYCVLRNRIRLFRGADSFLVFPVIKTSVARTILEHVGLRQPEPNLADIMKIQPSYQLLST